MTARDEKLLPGELDRILALEEENRILRRELESEEDALRTLERRVARLDEFLTQAEHDVKDAHDRVENLEDRVEVLENWRERFAWKHDPVDERELGEAGA